MYLQFLLFLALCQERLPSSLVPEPRLIDSVLKPEKPNLEGAMELSGHQNFNLHVNNNAIEARSHLLEIVSGEAI